MTIAIKRHRTHDRLPVDVDAVRKELDDGYELSQLHQGNSLRHARGWVVTIVDYILLAIPAIAPLPNLLNLQVALSPVLGYKASWIAAIALEILLVGTSEIFLYLQDKHMRYGGYKIALKIAAGAGAALLIILLALIAAFEVPTHGPAVLTLPFVSVIAIVFLSLKRWADIKDSIRREDTSSKENERVSILEERIRDMDSSHKLIVSKMADNHSAEMDRLRGDLLARSQAFEGERSQANEQIAEQGRERNAEREKMQQIVRGLEEKIQSFEASTREKDGRIVRMQEELALLRERNAEQRGQLSSRSQGRSTPRSQNARTNETPAEIMQRIYDHYATNPECSMGHAERALGYSKSTISKYLKELGEHGRMSKGGNGKWTVIE